MGETTYRASGRRMISADRRGFTLTELLIVVSMMSLILAIAMPRVKSATNVASVNSASNELATRVSMARQAAIRRGAPAVFRMSGNKAWITVEQNGTPVLFRDTLRLGDKYKVVATATVDSVRYDARGFASLGSNQRLKVVRGGQSSEVCVTAGGVVLGHGCTL
jgi:prepilin-type N-terminal cleavage/methylation domain-containing protein